MQETLDDKVIEVRITKLEGALLKAVRDTMYGQVTFTVFKVKGNPIRIELESVRESIILDAKDGLDLEGSAYVLPNEGIK